MQVEGGPGTTVKTVKISYLPSALHYQTPETLLRGGLSHFTSHLHQPVEDKGLTPLQGSLRTKYIHIVACITVHKLPVREDYLQRLVMFQTLLFLCIRGETCSSIMQDCSVPA